MRVFSILVLVGLCAGCSTPPPPADPAQAPPAEIDAPAVTEVTPDTAPAPTVPPSSVAPPRTSTPRRAETTGGRAPSSSVAPVTSPSAAAAPAPVLREVTVPAGTELHLELTTAVASDASAVEDLVRARVTRAVVVDGQTVIPAGAQAVGTVTEVAQAGRVKGRARIAFRFDSLRFNNASHSIQTDAVAREAEATRGEDATKVGVGAGVGAAIGGILGGGKGAAKGAAIGGAAGTGAVLATRGREVRLGAGDEVEARLSAPLPVYLPR